MASGSYNQVDVQCPFYKEDDGYKDIACEGVGDAIKLIQRYRYKSQFTKQMEVFCARHYQKCEVYRILMEMKYAE